MHYIWSTDPLWASNIQSILYPSDQASATKENWITDEGNQKKLKLLNQFHIHCYKINENTKAL